MKSLLHPKFIVPTFFATLMLCVFHKFSVANTAYFTSIPSMLLAYVFYLKTVFKKAPEPKKILPLYLLGVCWFPIHFAEEYLNGITTAFPKVFNANAMDNDFYLIFNMIALCFFIFSALCIYLKIQGPQLIALFFIIYGMFVNVLMHIYFQIKTGAYFPGFYTALPYLISPIGIYLFWKETRVESD